MVPKTTVTEKTNEIKVVGGNGVLSSVGLKSAPLPSPHIMKQMSWRNNAPIALKEVHLRLLGGDVSGATEQMKILLTEAKESTALMVLPDTAILQYRALVRTLHPILAHISDEYAVLSPSTPGEGSNYNRGEHISALYYELSHLSLLVHSLKLPLVNGMA